MAIFAGTEGVQKFIQDGILVPVRVRGVRRSVVTMAQVDTGSTISSVDAGLIPLLRVMPTGSLLVYGITGGTRLHTYPLRISTLAGRWLTRGPVLADNLAVPPSSGDAPPPIAKQVLVLLGREVLARLDLAVVGPRGSWRAN